MWKQRPVLIHNQRVQWPPAPIFIEKTRVAYTEPFFGTITVSSHLHFLLKAFDPDREAGPLKNEQSPEKHSVLSSHNS